MNETREKSSDEVRLPNSRKTYIETNGNTVNQQQHNLRVPFREIALSPSYATCHAAHHAAAFVFSSALRVFCEL